MKSTKLRSWTESLLGMGPLPAPPHVFSIDSGQLVYARFAIEEGWAPRLLERVASAIPAGILASADLGVRVLDAEGLEALVRDLVGRASGPIERASLIVPDAWLRLTFLDTEALPVAEDPRLEVLRWKMNRLLPFKVEELRIDAQEVDRLTTESAAVRTAIGFAREDLVAAIEKAFSAAKVELGLVTNRSSGLLAALAETVDEESLSVVVLVEESHYTLIAARRGQPVLYRYKALESDLSQNVVGEGVLRDLRLTRGFLAERVGDAEVEAVELVSEPAQRVRWQEWLRSGLGHDVRFHEFAGAGEDGETSALMGAMIGAVRQEIL
ncbi:MAG: hypothetical protein K8J08_05890 [Thermoanaerobaculia bacterium]|nr:hypothetical protein [Thermoanaerobaculia bacterium]